MDVTGVSIIHHIALALALLWILVSLGWGHPFAFFIALIYIYKVNERYSARLRRKIQFEERKSANQRRLLSDSESVRWLNHAVEKIWPICMEQIASQEFLLPIIPWFLEKYKPWTAKKAVVQNLYLGRSPPMFTEMRVVGESADDDHLVLELGMNFLSADDIDATLAVKLRKRLGFGIWANMHITGMHVEGKVLVGIKFLREWPFLGRVRVCFVEPPYFQMTVKPIFSHGVNVTEVPGIAGWLDKLLAIAFEQTLVEPNMLVIDVTKFASSEKDWFTVDEKPPIAYIKVEIIEATDLQPADLNGLSDPYVKGQLGPYRFQTKVQKKTLAPRWLEEFKIPISSWEVPNMLVLQVRDKDHIFDDDIGDCKVNVNVLNGGERRDIWLPLKNIKIGRLHLAVTILEAEDQKKPWKENPNDDKEPSKVADSETSGPCLTTKNSGIHLSPEEGQKMTDEYEPVDIEGQEKTGIWFHHPGRDLSQKWECRKGLDRHPETQVESVDSPKSEASSGSNHSDINNDERHGGKHVHRIKTLGRGIRKIGSLVHRGLNKGGSSSNDGEVKTPQQRPNIKAVGEKGVKVKFLVDDSEQNVDKGSCNPETGDDGSPRKGHAREMARNLMKQATKSAHSLKSVLSRKGLAKTGEDDGDRESDLSEDAMEEDEFVIGGSPIGTAASPSVHGEGNAHESPGPVKDTNVTENEDSTKNGHICE